MFWKHQRLMFFDAFSFAFPAALQRVPYSLLVSLIWTVVTYFPVGLAPQPSRWVAQALCRAVLCSGLMSSMVAACYSVFLAALMQTHIASALSVVNA